MKASAVIPPIDYQDYYVTIHIRIHSKSEPYLLRITGPRAEDHWESELLLTREDLRNLNKLLQSEAQKVVDTLDDQEPTETEWRMTLRSLARVGKLAFDSVFGQSDDTLTFVTKLLERESKRSVINLQFTAETFFLPWDLIYLESAEDPVSYENFWGMKYIISRWIPPHARLGIPNYILTAKPNIGLLANLSLASVEGKEIPFFKDLHKTGLITLYELRGLDPDKWDDEMREFTAFWEHPFHIAHFACHASYDDNNALLSYIELSDEFTIALKDLRIRVNGHPLIVMNACETGNLNPLYTSHFANTFIKLGALGVLTTECAMPDEFAADFARQLYKRLLANKPMALGRSLLATRKYFLKRHGNPMGLLYSIYGAPSIKVIKTGGKV